MTEGRKIYEDEDFVVTRDAGLGRIYGKRDEDDPSDLDLLWFFAAPVAKGVDEVANDDTARREFYRRFMERS